MIFAIYFNLFFERKFLTPSMNANKKEDDD